MALICYVVFVFVLFCLMPTDVHSCGQTTPGDSVNFPKKQDLMTIDDFTAHVLGKTLHEYYAGIPEHKPYYPNLDFVTTVTESGPNQYFFHSKGLKNTPGNNEMCETFNKTVNHTEGDNTAFFKQTETSILAYVTDCPELYAVVLRCKKYDFVNDSCLKNSTYFSVYIHTPVEIAPIYDIAVHIEKVMGVKMGSENYAWYYTYGDGCLN